ncbi:MAG: entericidin A/B family lipoprotein [Rhodospirillaceae bacterium]
MATSIQSILRVLTLIVSVALISLSFSGCNTIGGVGKDIESAGGAIEDAAD